MAGSVMEKQIENSSDDLILSSLEKDTIGEILNISMGAGATAISDLLNKKVVITTPIVEIIKSLEFEAKSLEPAVSIEIKYVEGLHSSNFMIMKTRDVRAMVNVILSSDENIDSEEALDEMHVSAISEIMNQMMGSSCTALANFFGKSINISTPTTFALNEVQNRIRDLDFGEFLVTVTFSLIVEDVIDSKFISILPMEFTKELVNNALNFGNGEDETTEEQRLEEALSNQQQLAAKSDIRVPPPVEIRREEQASSASNNKQPQVKVQPVKLANFDDDPKTVCFDPTQASLDMILGVPLEVTVEIGRTTKQVKEILDIRQGTIVELDKQAGDPVDILVNGQLIAKGDVVVIDDNFGVRITEIVTRKEIVNKLN